MRRQGRTNFRMPAQRHSNRVLASPYQQSCAAVQVAFQRPAQHPQKWSWAFPDTGQIGLNWCGCTNGAQLAGNIRGFIVSVMEQLWTCIVSAGLRTPYTRTADAPKEGTASCRPALGKVSWLRAVMAKIPYRKRGALVLQPVREETACSCVCVGLCVPRKRQR